ncbi:uncharacterized protein LOC144335570 [Macaca mulatta]
MTENSVCSSSPLNGCWAWHRIRASKFSLRAVKRSQAFASAHQGTCGVISNSPHPFPWVPGKQEDQAALAGTFQAFAHFESATFLLARAHHSPSPKSREESPPTTQRPRQEDGGPGKGKVNRGPFGPVTGEAHVTAVTSTAGGHPGTPLAREPGGFSLAQAQDEGHPISLDSAALHWCYSTTGSLLCPPPVLSVLSQEIPLYGVTEHSVIARPSTGTLLPSRGLRRLHVSADPRGNPPSRSPQPRRGVTFSHLPPDSGASPDSGGRVGNPQQGGGILVAVAGRPGSTRGRHSLQSQRTDPGRLQRLPPATPPRPPIGQASRASARSHWPAPAAQTKGPAAAGGDWAGLGGGSGESAGRARAASWGGGERGPGGGARRFGPGAGSCWCAAWLGRLPSRGRGGSTWVGLGAPEGGGRGARGAGIPPAPPPAFSALHPSRPRAPARTAAAAASSSPRAPRPSPHRGWERGNARTRTQKDVPEPGPAAGTLWQGRGLGPWRSKTDAAPGKASRVSGSWSFGASPGREGLAVGRAAGRGVASGGLRQRRAREAALGAPPGTWL